jgi:hypothetical protein
MMNFALREPSEPRPDGATDASYDALLRLMIGPWIAQAIFVAAKLDLADRLRDGPQPVAALAAASGADPAALYRVLRALASVGVFRERDDGCFALTPLAQGLRGDVPASLRDYAIMLGERWIWLSLGEMLHSVRTGETAFARVFAAPIFEYYAAHPDAASTSARGLAARSVQENAAILAAYDFSAAPHVIDVGGGQGTLLQAILERHPDATGMLFERPQVAAMARAQFKTSDLAPRCRVIAGDFFRSIPTGGDLYLLKKVIHDWDDARAVTILRSCRAAMAPQSRLLLLEPVIAEPNAPSFAKLLDLLMLVVSGGQERSADAHSALLARAGLRLTRLIPTASTISIIEAVPLGAPAQTTVQ